MKDQKYNYSDLSPDINRIPWIELFAAVPPF